MSRFLGFWRPSNQDLRSLYSSPDLRESGSTRPDRAARECSDAADLKRHNALQECAAAREMIIIIVIISIIIIIIVIVIVIIIIISSSDAL